jgi:hypothetical protein
MHVEWDVEKIALSFSGKGSHCGGVYLAVAVLLGVNRTIFRVIMVLSGLETIADLRRGSVKNYTT